MVTKSQLDSIMKKMDPVISFGLIVAILDLAAPLDYHLIQGELLQALSPFGIWYPSFMPKTGMAAR